MPARIRGCVSRLWHTFPAGGALAAVLMAGSAGAATTAASQAEPDARRNAVAPTSKASASTRAVAGRSARKAAFSEQKLVALLPERIGEWKRTGYGNPIPETGHDVMPAMEAQYERGTEEADVEMTDLGQAGILAAREAASAPSGERTTDSGRERTYRAGERVFRESRDAQTGATSVSVVLPNGLSIRVSGRRSDGAGLQQVLEGIDLAGAEALRRGSK